MIQMNQVLFTLLNACLEQKNHLKVYSDLRRSKMLELRCHIAAQSAEVVKTVLKAKKIESISTDTEVQQEVINKSVVVDPTLFV